MVFAGFYMSTARYVSVTVESIPPPEAVFVTGNFDVSGATLIYKDQLVVIPTDIEFKPDGTKLFVAVEGSTSIYEYALSNAWDLTTVSADATTSLSVANMSQVQTIDFNHTGTNLYACGSGNVAEFSMSSAYDLTTTDLQSTLDISVYSGQTIYGACFSNSVSNNYLHFTSSGTGNVNTISTIDIASPLSGSTFLGRSANVVPLINNVVAPDLHTTRTLEVSGGGTRFYQIYRNTDLSNVYIVEFKLGTPHDASTLTSATQIEDYFDIATQTGGTTLYDTFNSLKIKPDGSELFLSGTYFYDATNNRTSLTSSAGSVGDLVYSRDLKYVLVHYGQASRGNIKIFEYDSDADTFTQIHNLTGTDTNRYDNGFKAITKLGNRFFNCYKTSRYFTVNDYDGSSWSVTQTITLTSPYTFTDAVELSENEDMLFCVITGYTSPVGAIGLYTESGGSWSQTQLIRNPFASSDSNFNTIRVSSDNSTLLLGDAFSNYNQTDNGVVFVYSNVAGTWTYTNETLDSPYSGVLRHAFTGLAINNDGTRAFVGAIGYSSFLGTVSVYDYNGSAWSLSHSINGVISASQFGISVSCSSDGNRFIVGAYYAQTGQGQAYIYDYDGTTWSISQTFTRVYSSRRFGHYVGISPDKSRLTVSESYTSGQGYIHYYTSPKNTQTYRLDIPTPVLYISGDQVNTYDIWGGTANVTATGTGVFTQDTSIFKVGTGSISFDNSATSVVVPNFPEANTFPMSVAFWYHKTNTDTEDVLFTTSSFNSGSGTTAGFSIHAQSTAGEYIEIECNSGNFTKSSIQCPNYAWNHVVVTIDSSGSVEIYINGTRDTSTTASGWDLTSSNFATGQNFVLGDDSTSSSHFGGYMDDIKVFNTLLPEKTIKKIYLDGLVPPRTQVFHLTFEDNTGADLLPSGASLGGTSLATLQSNTLTYQGDYVGDFTTAISNVSVENWTNFDTTFTMSFWLYTTDYHSNTSTLLYTSDLYNSPNQGFMYQFINQNELNLLFRGATNLSYNISGTVSLTNKWSHHVITYDGTTIKLYLDNVSKGTFTANAPLSSGQTIYFMKGYSYSSGSDIRDAYGYLDDIRIYDYVLDPKEVEYLYTSTLVHTRQSFYLSYDQSNVYEYHAGTSNVPATGTGVYYQNPGSRIGTYSGEYPQGTIGTVVPTWSDLTSGTVLTFSMWIFPTVLTGTHTLYATENFGSGAIGIGAQLVNSSGNLQVRLLTKVSNSVRYRYVNLAGVSNFTNKWIHLVFVYSSVSTDSKIFVNGAVQTLSTSSTWSFNGVPSGDDLRIGNYNGTSTNEFSGALDDFRVFTRQLSDKEIQGLYKQYTESRIYTVSTSSS